MDIFEPLKGYEGLYEINKNGEIKTIKRKGTDERILKHCILKSGYKAYSLYKNGIGKTKTLHRLLAIQFIPNNDNKRCIDHIDRNRLNNNLDNLRWATHSENSSNIEHKGSIFIDKSKINNKEYIYYRVVYKGERKRFKTEEEAEQYLEQLKKK